MANRPRLALDALGRVLPPESLIRRGLCPICGEIETHYFVSQGFNRIKVPHQEVRDNCGNRVVCQGMCLLPTCRRGPLPPPPLHEIETLLNRAIESGVVAQVAVLVEKVMNESPFAKSILSCCMTAILTVCAQHDHFKTEAIPIGVPECIEQCMKNHPRDEDLQELACSALWALAGSSSLIRADLIRKQVSRQIFVTMKAHESSEAVVVGAIGCLRSLSEGEDYGQILRDSDEISLVCHILQRHLSNKAIQIDGFGFLSNTIIDLKTNSVAKATPRELETILEGIKKHMNDESVRAVGCIALLNYTSPQCTNGEQNLMTLCNRDDVVLVVKYVYDNADLTSQTSSAVLFDRIQNCIVEAQLIAECM